MPHTDRSVCVYDLVGKASEYFPFTSPLHGPRVKPERLEHFRSMCALPPLLKSG